MTEQGRKGPIFRAVKRKTVMLSEEELVRRRHFDPEEKIPLVVEPSIANLNLLDWAAGHRDLVDRWLLESGAILFRGFGIDSPERFREIAETVSGNLLEYQERAAPRIKVEQNVYTSTEFPADQTIPMHHEMSYSSNWPSQIWFYCAQPSEEGGRTPIADDRKVVGRIDPAVQEEFKAKNIMYVRNYGEGVDLSWQEAFQTEDRGVVEDYCRRTRMAVEWRDGDRLRTRRIGSPYATHPRTGDTLWFNHAHMFHHSNLPREVREALLAEFAEDELPRNVFYGDGSAIDPAVLDEIRRVYEEAAYRFEWRQGDLLMVDNFLVSHGREPFSGPRKILVAMANLYTSPELG